MLLATGLFALAAVGGMVLATLHFRGRPRPLPLALLHLVVAASGLVSLLIAVVDHPTVLLAKVALGIMVVVAAGGFLLLSFRVRRKELPTPLVVIHGLAAVGGFLTLVAALLSQQS